MYASDAQPKCEMLAFFTAGDEEETAECWPDNWMPLKVFEAMSTQWNAGPGGVIGLKYEAMPAVSDLLCVRKKARAEIFTSLRIMENEALQVINKT